VAVELHRENIGEDLHACWLLTPDYQGRQHRNRLDRVRARAAQDAGMAVAMVETGTTQARRGTARTEVIFTHLPIARCFKEAVGAPPPPLSLTLCFTRHVPGKTFAICGASCPS